MLFTAIISMQLKEKLGLQISEIEIETQAPATACPQYLGLLKANCSTILANSSEFTALAEPAIMPHFPPLLYMDTALLLDFADSVGARDLPGA